MNGNTFGAFVLRKQYDDRLTIVLVVANCSDFWKHLRKIYVK